MPKHSQSRKTTTVDTISEKKNRDFIPVEVSLERIAYFTPSKNGVNGIADKIVNHEDLQVSLRVSPSIGLPVTSDQDLYRAFQKIVKDHVDADHNLLRPIEVSTNQLLRYAGKSKRAGANKTSSTQEVRRWLDRMAGVLIKATFTPGKSSQPITIRGTVFDTVLSPGEEFEDGEIAETNYVWLSRWYLSSIAAGYLRTVDLDFHNGLRKPIAKAVYPILQTGWFASSRKEQLYKKRYSHLCEMFLLERYSSLSRIKQQLEPSFHELRKTGFLKSWSFTRSKSDPKDWVIAWVPGGKYLDDRRALRERKEIALKIKSSLETGPALSDLSGAQSVLLEDILSVCQDRKSEAGYRRVIQTYSESIIRAALSETKLAAHQGAIRKSRGAFFMDTLKRLGEYRLN